MYPTDVQLALSGGFVFEHFQQWLLRGMKTQMHELN
jgi:hypothetical protein